MNTQKRNEIQKIENNLSREELYEVQKFLCWMIQKWCEKDDDYKQVGICEVIEEAERHLYYSETGLYYKSRGYLHNAVKNDIISKETAEKICDIAEKILFS